MKKSKLIIIFTSIILVSSLFVGGLAAAKDENSPLAHIWNAIFDLQTQVDELEASTTTRYVIEGTIDLTQDGDVAAPTNEYSNIVFHWKRIPVPQLTLDDMPLINVYLKPPSNEFSSPFDKWRDNGEDWGYYYLKAVYDEQSVLICYKRVDNLGETTYFINGLYKIVVVK